MKNKTYSKSYSEEQTKAGFDECYCNWTSIEEGVYTIACKGDNNIVLTGEMDFIYCPYCGKKIKDNDMRKG